MARAQTSSTAKTSAPASAPAYVKALQTMALAVACVCCIVGFFLCGGVLIAMLHDPTMVIALACVFAAGAMVTGRELLGPAKPKPVQKA